jgi:hypothetical protein
MKSKNIANMAQVEEHLAEFHLQYYKKRKENKGALGFFIGRTRKSLCSPKPLVLSDKNPSTSRGQY